MMGDDVNDWDNICGEPANEQNNNTRPDGVTFYCPISKVKDQEESLKKICHNIPKTDANVKEKYFEDYQSSKFFHGPTCVIVASQSAITVSIFINLKQ